MWQEVNLPIQPLNLASLFGVPNAPGLVIDNWTTDQNGNFVGTANGEPYCGASYGICLYWNAGLQEWDAPQGGDGLTALFGGWDKITFPLEVLQANIDMLGTGLVVTAAGGGAMALGCGLTPAEPFTCGVAIAGGAPTAIAGIGIIGGSGWFFTHYTWPILRHWGVE